MRCGFSLPNNQGVARVATLVDLAVAAENLNYDSVWVSEHLFHATYVAERLGDAPYHEPLTVLTAVAAVTSRVRLGTSVLVLPWHHPVRLAKTIATLDDLSNGRVDLGVGVAVTEDEYANLGVDFGTRGARADDALAAMQALWTQDVPSHAGRFYAFDGLRFSPKPLQQPHPPILVGGGAAAFPRIVRFGNGWHALSQSPDDMARGLDALHALCRREGRNPDELTVSVRLVLSFVDASWERPVTERRTLKGTAEELRAMLAAYQAVGVDEVVIDPGSRDPAVVATTLARFRREVLS